MNKDLRTDKQFHSNLQKRTNAQDIFQQLEDETQKAIKENRKDVYSALFSKNYEVTGEDLILIDEFIQTYSKITNPDATTEPLPSNDIGDRISKAKDLFEIQSEERKKEIKEKRPDLYTAIFQKNETYENDRMTKIDEFISIYENDKIRLSQRKNNFAIDTFASLSLEQQLKFKKNHPDLYGTMFK